jgi:hypothetical protein
MQTERFKLLCRLFGGVLISIGMAGANTVYQENFNDTWSTNSPPANWTINYTGSIGNSDWHRRTSSDLKPPGGSGAYSRLYRTPAETGEDKLTSPIINCSGYLNVKLKIDDRWDRKGSPYTAQILGSSDGGSTWPYTIYNYTSDEQTDDHTFDISAWANNNSNVQIRFYGNGNSDKINHWCIDNFIIEGTPASADIYAEDPLVTGNQPALNQVWAGASYVPYDTVGNNGSSTANTITIITRIGNWTNTAPVISSLTSGSKQRINFGNWTVDRVPGTNYSRVDTTYAASPTDPNLANNRAVLNLTGVYDGETVDIDQPPDTIFTGKTYNPEATVRNNSGAGAADFTVTCTINGGYSSTRTITNLAAGNATQVVFDPWTTGHTANATYTVTVTCQTTGDVNTNNNTKTKTYQSYGDVGPSNPVAPLDTVYTETKYKPTAKIKNYTAGITESFNVTCLVLDQTGNVMFLETKLDSFGPNEEKPVVFNEWEVGSLEGVTYQIQVSTHLAGDFVPSNDSLVWEVVSKLPPDFDAGVVYIDEPTGSIRVGSTIQPNATVKNFGTNTVSFGVTCTIGDYTSTRSVADLVSSATQQVIFDDWKPTAPGSYTMTIFTRLTDDANATNDTMTEIISATGIIETRQPVPVKYSLEAARPNPAAAGTLVRYALPVNAPITLAIYDITGKLIMTLIMGNESAGYKSIRWDGKDNSGKIVPNGIYFIRFETPNYSATGKLVLTR